MEQGYLLWANAVLATFILAGTWLNGMWMIKTRARRRLVIESKQNGVALITVSRAVRNETAYFLIQLILLAVSAWALTYVVPSAPASAERFYFGSMVARAVVSMILVYASWADLRDRKLLHDARNRERLVAFRKELPDDEPHT